MAVVVVALAVEQIVGAQIVAFAAVVAEVVVVAAHVSVDVAAVV